MPDRRSLALALAGALVVAGGWLIAGADGAPQSVGPGPRAAEAASAEVRSQPAGQRSADARGPAATADDRDRREVRSPAVDEDPAGSPLIVSGRVIDDLGRPVAGARVVLVRAAERYADARVARLLRDRLPQPAWRAGAGTVQEIQLVPDNWDPLAGGVPTQNLVFGALGTDGVVRISVNLSDVSLGIDDEETLAFTPRADASTQIIREFPPRTAETDRDGRFEIHGEVPLDAPLAVRASAHLHLDGDEPVPAPGSEVAITLRRGACLESRITIPEWLPAESVSLTLVPRSEGGSSIEGTSVEGVDGRTVLVDAGTTAPGIHELTVHVAGMPEPVYRVPDLALVIGDQQPDTRGTRIDLTNAVFRYQVHAIDGAGRPIPDLESPLLVRVRDGEDAGWAAFPWRGSGAEFFAARPTVDVVAFAPGYRRRDLVLSSGATELRLVRLPPVEIVLPGLRALCAPEHRVRISMVREGDTGMPSSIQAVDPRSGESRGYSRWHLGVSGGAWLGDTDVVAVPLVLDGRYGVIVRLRQREASAEVSIPIGDVEVSFDATARPRAALAIDPDRIRAGLAQLRERAER